MSHCQPRTPLFGSLLLCPLLLGGCLADKEYIEGECTPKKTAQALLDRARSRAQADYLPVPVQACTPLDRPPDGDKAAQGLVFEEYAALISGSSGNFMDDGTWWAKALPRGELHVHPTQLHDEACSPLQYQQFDYAYSAPTPAVSPLPDCGRALVGVSFGHRFFESHPQVLELDASAYSRLVTLRLNPIFGASFRFATEDATYPGEQFPLLEDIHVLEHDSESLTFAASVSAASFEGAIQARLVPAAESALHVEATFYPRRPGASLGRLGVFGISSMFWKRDDETPELADDEAHDSDEFVIHLADEEPHTIRIENPARDQDSDSWVRRTFSDRALTGFSLRQTERDSRRYRAYQSARYAERPTLRVEAVESNVPLVTELAVSHADSEYIDNLVVNVFVDPTAVYEGPIQVRYTLYATQD